MYIKRVIATGVLCLCTFGTSVGGSAQSFADLPVAPHPRIVANAQEFAALKQRIPADTDMSLWYARVRTQAEIVLQAPKVEHVLPDGIRLLATSREVMSRVYTMAFMYRMTGETRYAERAWFDLSTAAAFRDWNPSHFLDVGEMSYAFAIGYDWLYDYWTVEQRKILAEAIIQKGLYPALQAYRSNNWWTKDISNWNMVCNGGISMAAIAIVDEYPDLTHAILQYAFTGMSVFWDKLDKYEGSWDEGPGYWNYSMMYMNPTISTYKAAFGTDFGVLDRVGVREAGAFPIYVSGPTGHAFNYGDGSTREPGLPVLFWFAKQFNRAEFAKWQYDDLKTRGIQGEAHLGVWNLLWYPGPIKSELPPLDKYFPGTEVVTFRSAWDDKDALFLGFKGGNNAAPHGDLDLGTFVLDALGVRWANELGSDSYALPGYFDQDKTGTKLGGQRWNYYRKRAEGQNTLVINPSRYLDQDSRAKAPIIYHHFGAGESVAIADLSQAYGIFGRNVSVKRGAALFDNRRQVLIQDEISASTKSSIWWFMQTDQKAELSSDGKLATLINGDKRMEARILSPQDARFTVMDAVPLPTSPNPAGQNANSGKRKLAINVVTDSETRITVLLSPLKNNEEITVLPKVRPLAEWQKAGEATLWESQERVNVEFRRPSSGVKLQGSAALSIKLDGILPERVKNIALLLNDQTIFSGKALPTEMPLNTVAYPDGVHKLSLRLTTADDLQITKMVSFEIDNHWETVDHMKAPTNLGVLGRVNHSLTEQESQGWNYANEPKALFGDESRRYAASRSDEYMVWKAPRVETYSVMVYGKTNWALDALRIYVSPDGTVWNELKYNTEIVNSTDEWTQWRVHGSANTEANWLKLVRVDDTVPDVDVQIGSVTLAGLY